MRGKVISELNAMFGIKGLYTRLHTHQTNSSCKRLNVTLAKMLAHYSDKCHNNWAKLVKPLCYVNNALPHSTTGITLCEAMFGYKPLFLQDANIFLATHNDVVVGNMETI